MKTTLLAASLLALLLVTTVSLNALHQAAPTAGIPLSPPSPPAGSLPAFAERGLAWLAAAQYENGGWGAGSFERQDVQDPHAVQVDPATTAFAAMAFLQAGSTLEAGPYRNNVRQALDYLLTVVEAAPANGDGITDIRDTQPQRKLGQQIDVSMSAQFFAKVLPHTQGDARLENRVTAALDKCLRLIERTQSTDGSWNDQGWAPVLQSAMANAALEQAQASGRRVDEDVLARSKAYQRRNVDAATGAVRTESAAGVSLYSISSSQRAAAPEAKEARARLNDAKDQGLLEADAVINAENLVKAGASRDEAEVLTEAYRQQEATKQLLQDETVLSGFGNNGGEEFLSYMMTSEALAVAGSEDWADWHDKMTRRLEKIQNPNGSWSGHHCITSPVFCTAAVILALTADQAFS